MIGVTIFVNVRLRVGNLLRDGVRFLDVHIHVSVEGFRDCNRVLYFARNLDLVRLIFGYILGVGVRDVDLN